MLTEIQPIDWTTIEHQIGALPKAFQSRKHELRTLIEQVEFHRDTHCTGKEHWRDAQNSKHRPKLYIIHKTHAACPIHGTPEPGQRIRTYIGSDPINIREAQAAMKRGKDYRDNMSKLNHKYQLIRTATYTLQRIYWELGITVPESPPKEPE